MFIQQYNLPIRLIRQISMSRVHVSNSISQSVAIDNLAENPYFESCWCHNQQDAREAMRVVFFCTYKTYLYA